MRFTLVEFLDKGRPGMASAVLTRMRVGDKIVEPKGVSRLYQSRISTSWLVLLVLAAVVHDHGRARGTAGRPDHHPVRSDLQLSAFWHWLTGLLP